MSMLFLNLIPFVVLPSFTSRQIIILFLSIIRSGWFFLQNF